MNKYYFTFGSDERYPFQNGHLIVEANDINDAIKCFQKHYPNRPNSDTINCAFYYSEKQWSNVLKRGFHIGEKPKEILVANIISHFKEQMEDEYFIYKTSFANENVTFMGKDEYGYYRMQREFENGEEEKSVHYFACLEKMESYCDSWYGEGWFSFVEEQYNQEKTETEEVFER